MSAIWALVTKSATELRKAGCHPTFGSSFAYFSFTEMFPPLSLYSDRFQAGRLLASALAGCADCLNVVALALPRGGVPGHRDFSQTSDQEAREMLDAGRREQRQRQLGPQAPAERAP